MMKRTSRSTQILYNNLVDRTYKSVLNPILVRVTHDQYLADILVFYFLLAIGTPLGSGNKLHCGSSRDLQFSYLKNCYDQFFQVSRSLYIIQNLSWSKSDHLIFKYIRDSPNEIFFLFSVTIYIVSRRQVGPGFPQEHVVSPFSAL